MFSEFKIGQTMNDFSISYFDRDWKSDWKDLFAAQTAGLKINLMSGELIVYVRQLKSGKIQDVVFHMITSNGRTLDQIRVRPAKSKKKGAEYVFNDGKLIDHCMELDYRSKEVIHHRLTFKFDRINLYSPTNEQPISHYIDSGESERVNSLLDSIPNVDGGVGLNSEDSIITTNDPKDV